MEQGEGDRAVPHPQRRGPRPQQLPRPRRRGLPRPAAARGLVTRLSDEMLHDIRAAAAAADEKPTKSIKSRKLA